MVQEKPVKFGIVGADKAGAFYAQALASVPGAQLTSICDPDLLRAQRLAWEHNALPYCAIQKILPHVDAVIVTSPVKYHHTDALCCLRANKHTLVEKPLATTLTHAKELLLTAQHNAVALQVGHLERFNPATVEAVKHIKDPRFITIERLSPYDPHSAPIGAVMDLMLQDLDLLLTLVPHSVTAIDATGLSVFSEREDIANVRLHFANGAVADVTASRASFERKRTLHAFEKEGYVSVDFLNARVKTYRKEKPVIKTLRDITVAYPKVEKQPPLLGELLHFIRNIRAAQTSHTEGGMQALELALKITEQIQLFDVPKTGHLHTPKPFRIVSDAAAAARIALDETIGKLKQED